MSAAAASASLADLLRPRLETLLSSLPTSPSSAPAPVTLSSSSSSPSVPSSSSSPTPLSFPPLSSSTKSDLQRIWTESRTQWLLVHVAEKEGEGKEAGLGKVKEEDILDEDILSGELEGLGREFLLDVAYEEPPTTTPTTPTKVEVEEKIKFLGKVWAALEIVWGLFEVVAASYPTAPTPLALDPGTLLIPLLDELADVLSLEGWGVLWGWVEGRGEGICSEMIQSKGKSLTLLKFVNHLLRLTSHLSSSHSHPYSSNPSSTSASASLSDLGLRARIHIFISEYFKLADPSGANIRGEYAEGRGFWPKETVEGMVEAEVEEEVEAGGEGVNKEQEEGEGEKMAVDATIESKPDAPKEEVEEKPESLYTALHLLSLTFITPSLLSLPSTITTTYLPQPETSLQAFRRRSERVLAELEKRRGEAVEVGKVWREVGGRGSGREEEGKRVWGREEYPVFSTSAETVEADLANPTYRKRLYAQFLIILQHMTMLGAKDKAKQPKEHQFPPAFVMPAEDVDWAKERIAEIKLELHRTMDGREFWGRVMAMLDMDRHWTITKSAPNASLEPPPIDSSTIDDAEKNRQKLVAPLRPYRWEAGTRSLSRLGQGPLRSVEQLKGFKVAETLEGLKEKYDREVAEEEDEIAMGKDYTKTLNPFIENKASLSWKALRLASTEYLDAFPGAQKGDLASLMNSINELKAGKVAGPLAVKAANGNEAMRNDSVEPGTNGVADLEKKVNAEVEVKNEDVEMTEVPAAEAESAAVAPESQDIEMA